MADSSHHNHACNPELIAGMFDALAHAPTGKGLKITVLGGDESEEGAAESVGAAKPIVLVQLRRTHNADMHCGLGRETGEIEVVFEDGEWGVHDSNDGLMPP